ncbi:MAG: M67 family metallopeptidase [Acidimicrobiales bacterium]|nr:M67 family metallopeptidase [Acidimicrobiales bacterium]
MIRITENRLTTIFAHCLSGLPYEACGLISAKDPGSKDILGWYPTENAANSARYYTIDPKGYLMADRDAESRGEAIVGVVHSHTHSDPYPSPTDVQQAPDPTWHYVIVSLRHASPMLRSFRIESGNIQEERVVVIKK